VPDTGTLTNLHIGQSPRAGKGFANDLHFRVVLCACREMLPIATATTIGDVTTRGPHPRGSRRRNAHEPGSCEIAFHFDEFGIDVLTRDDAFHEHDTTIGVARHTIAAGDQAFDVQSSSGTDARS